jgi:hypothetical protein
MLAVRAMVVRPLAAVTARCAKGLAISHSLGNRSQGVAKSVESGEPVFTLLDDGRVTLRTVAWRLLIVRQKKGPATISLGLNTAANTASWAHRNHYLVTLSL